jgi:hypothetical protein
MKFIARVMTKELYAYGGTFMGFDTNDVEIEANDINEARELAQGYGNGVAWVEPKADIEAREQKQRAEAEAKAEAKKKAKANKEAKANAMGMTLQEYEQNERRKAELRKIARDKAELLKQLAELEARENYLQKVVK